MKRKNRTLTERELDVMKVVWRLESATVRQVYEAMGQRGRGPAYTTVLTLLKILEGKGFLTKSEANRAHVYTPSRPRSEVLSNMVQEFLDRVFNGSPEPLLLNLVQSKRLSEADLEELAKRIRESK